MSFMHPNHGLARNATPCNDATHQLFSYGTLQLESVQRALFNRTLSGRSDALPMFNCALLKIDDPAEATTLGKTHHAIAQYTGNASDEITGTALFMTNDELLRADGYEPPEYKRVEVTLRSGARAWLYVDVKHAPPE